MRLVRAVSKEAALDENDILLMLRHLDEDPTVFPRILGRTGVLRRYGTSPPQNGALVEAKDGPDATEGSKSNFFEKTNRGMRGACIRPPHEPPNKWATLSAISKRPCAL